MSYQVGFENSQPSWTSGNDVGADDRHVPLIRRRLIQAWKRQEACVDRGMSQDLCDEASAIPCQTRVSLSPYK